MPIRKPINLFRSPDPADRLRIHVRWLCRRDLSEVMEIEDASFDHPQTVEQMLEFLTGRSHIGMVAEHGETIAGFMLYDLRKTSLHVHDFAVRPDFRRQGVGYQMAMKLVNKLSVHRRMKITLYVRETNRAGIDFMSRMGFLATHVVREHYEADTHEDAYAMSYDLATATAGDGECFGR